MSGESASGTEQEFRCVGCGMIRDSTYFGLADDEDYVAVLEHFLIEHPGSEAFRRVIESTWVEVECEECGKAFNSPVKIGYGRFLAENYCTRCANHYQPIKQLVVRDVSAIELLENNVDPLEDTDADSEWRSRDEFDRSVDTGSDQDGDSDE